MSHSKERDEKICLNCSSEVHGRYCHVCGQQNIEPKQTVWHLVTHFFNDITHFDGKFFHTLKYLIARPGYLSKQYIQGRRADYLDPIRMYVFTSAIFFIFFYSAFDVREMGNYNPGKGNKADRDSLVKDINEARLSMLRTARTKEDSVKTEKFFTAVKGVSERVDDKDLRDATRGKRNGWGLTEERFKSLDAYDSAQRKLPAKDRDGYFERLIAKRQIEIASKYGKKSESDFWKDVVDKFMHTFPYLLFISLPLYALFLKLLYIRRKQYYYVDHGIFLVHLYIFTFLTLLIYFGIEKLNKTLQWGFWLGLLEVLLFFYGVGYTIVAMKRFYGQGKGKTFLKFILFNILCIIAISFLFSIFFAVALMRV